MSRDRFAHPNASAGNRVLRAAATLLRLEGATLLVVAVTLVVADTVGRPENHAGLLLLAVVTAVAGVLLTLSAGPLLALRGWVRSPVVVAQLLTLPVGGGLVQAHLWRAAGPVLALPLVTLLLLAAPAARRPFRAGPSAKGPDAPSSTG